jgi:RNA 3'-terminal phosphate cyclase (ATP)
VKVGNYSFNIGSAGSTTLVLQTVLLPLALAGASSRLTIQGGKHNIAAPPFEFLDHAFLRLLRRMGFSVAAQLVRPGFYPAGGGEIAVEIEACDPLKPLVLETRGALVSRKIEAFVTGLPFAIAKREVAHAGSLLGWPDADCHPRAFDGAHGPGNAVSVHVEHENVTEVFVGFGRHGVSSEAVAAEAVREASTYLAGEHPVGPHLADQLLLPLVLAAGGCFTTGPLSEHTRTNIAVIQRFLTASILVDPMAESGALRIAVEHGGAIGVE